MQSKLRLSILSKKPLLFYSGMYAAGGNKSDFWEFSDRLLGRKVTTLMLVAWTAEHMSASAQGIIDWRKDFMKYHPDHNIIFLANSYPEYENLKYLGAPVIFCNHNTFVDRNLFKPFSDTIDLKYDAVYNAQFLSFKRHELATAISSLVLIGYNASKENADIVRSALPGATYANFEMDGSFRWLNQPQVNRIYNESSVGLCLSAKEGAMHASMEYLLAGLPVVTTHCAGGRNYFFDGRFVHWVNDDPVAVMKAVDAFVSAKIDREFIRSEVLRKIDYEMERFFEALFSITNNLELVNDIQSNWSNIFNDKLIVPKSFDELSEQLDI
jgi:glycosyltransferase involved in cell wall biosynthesis